MPNIYRFLIKTLCVFGVTFTLTLPHNNAWGISKCECKSATSCTFQSSEEEDKAAWSWVQICKPYNTYCLREHQELWAADIYKITCPAGSVVIDGFDCGCQGPWQGASEEEEEEGGENPNENAYCSFAYQCPDSPVWRIPSVDTSPPTGYIAKSECIYSSIVADMIVYSCDTAKGYYMSDTQITHPEPKLGATSPECWNMKSETNVSLTITFGYGISEQWSGCSYCNETTPEWKNCSDSGMNCFANDGSVTLCAPGETDGTNGCYDPNLYERQVGYTFNASANDGNGSCALQITGNEWRCKKGYYPTDIKTYAESDLQREPNFRCTPCPVGYVGAEYNDKTQTWLHDTSFDNDLGASSGDIHSCKKCPAGQSTFLSDTDAPLHYFEGADDICYPCPDGYFNDGTQNISLTVYEINGSPIPPTPKSGNGCELCPQGTYSTSGATACDNCPAAFTTVLPLESDLTTHNDSIQMCYIDPNVMLSDSLGKIKLSEEIGSGTKLYHQ